MPGDDCPQRGLFRPVMADRAALALELESLVIRGQCE
jgi:hypothetical protein